MSAFHEVNVKLDRLLALMEQHMANDKREGVQQSGVVDVETSKLRTALVNAMANDKREDVQQLGVEDVETNKLRTALVNAMEAVRMEWDGLKRHRELDARKQESLKRCETNIKMWCLASFAWGRIKTTIDNYKMVWEAYEAWYRRTAHGTRFENRETGLIATLKQAGVNEDELDRIFFAFTGWSRDKQAADMLSKFDTNMAH